MDAHCQDVADNLCVTAENVSCQIGLSFSGV